MALAYPAALLLVPLALVAVLTFARRPRAAIAWPGGADLADLRDRWTRPIQSALWLAALVFAALALAGWQSRPRDVSLAIGLVADVSGSMAEPDSTGRPRIAAMKALLGDLIAARPRDRIGLTLFAAHPDLACPPTLDHPTVTRSLEQATPRGIPTESETNIGDAIAFALARLTPEPGGRVIVVCSDGEQNVPPPALTPRQAGQLAASLGIPVITIEVGPQPSRLTTLARMTGGVALSSASAGEVAGHLDRFAGASSATNPILSPWPTWLAITATAAGLGWWWTRRIVPVTDRLIAPTAGIALACFVMAAVDHRAEPSPALGPDVALVADLSRSMQARDAVPDRLTQGVRLLGELCERLDGSRVALTAFAGTAATIGPLTADRAAIGSLLAELPESPHPELHPHSAASGTRIGEAIVHAATQLPGDRPRRIVLLSDGDDPADDGEWRSVAKLGIPVHVIGIGSPTAATAVPGIADARSRRRDDVLRQIAEMTGGSSSFVEAGRINIGELAARVRGGAVAPATSARTGWPWLAIGWLVLAVGLVLPRPRAWLAAPLLLAGAAMPEGPIGQIADRSTDPGLVAFHRGVELARLGRHRDAAEQFQRSLSDAAGDRRARALYNLGLCQLHSADRPATLRAIESLRSAREQAGPALATDIETSLTIAERMLALLNEGAKSGEGDDPTTRPPDRSAVGEPANAKSPRSKSGDATVGQPKPGGKGQETDQLAPGAGNLPAIPDTDELMPILDPRRYLDEVERRVRATRSVKRGERDRPRTEYPDW